jgi:hypothetical protein
MLVRLDKTGRTGNKQNTGINTLGIMRKMGEAWRGVETNTKTGERLWQPLAIRPKMLIDNYDFY